jgi:LPXTG-motif cell wall-anchored protein
MKRPINSALRLGAVLAVGSALAISSGSVNGQVVDISAAVSVVPSSTTPGTVVVATAAFENLGLATSWKIAFSLEGTDGAGSFAGPVTITGSAQNCDVQDQRVECDWSPDDSGVGVSLSVNINVAAGATPASPGWTINAVVEGSRILDSTRLEIVALPVTDPPVTDPPAVDPPPPAVDPPASGGAATAAPTQLPATGTSLWPFVLVGFLALAAGAGALRLSRSD